jgi:hypothetical protein
MGRLESKIRHGRGDEQYAILRQEDWSNEKKREELDKIKEEQNLLLEAWNKELTERKKMEREA